MIVLINPDECRAVRNKEALLGFTSWRSTGTRRRCSVGGSWPGVGQPERDLLNAAAFTLSHLNHPVVGSVIP